MNKFALQICGDPKAKKFPLILPNQSAPIYSRKQLLCSLFKVFFLFFLTFRNINLFFFQDDLGELKYKSHISPANPLENPVRGVNSRNKHNKTMPHPSQHVHYKNSNFNGSVLHCILLVSQQHIYLLLWKNKKGY